MPSRRPLSVAVLLIAVLVLGACGDDSPFAPEPWSYVGSATLNTQAQVDSMAGVTQVMGDLVIMNTSMLDPIRDLSPLRDLERVMGSLSLENNAQVRDLRALDSLVRVYSTLDLRPRAAATLDGLASLESVGWLHLRWSDGRTPIPELYPDRMERGLIVDHIDDLADLGNLAPLPPLATLVLRDLHDLTSLAGVADLDSLDRLVIDNCDGLTTLEGLPALPSLKKLVLASSSSLVDLRGLPPVPALEYLEYDRMALVESVAGLSGGEGPLTFKAWDCSVFHTLADLPAARSLSRLIIYQCEAITDLGGEVRFAPESSINLREVWNMRDLAWVNPGTQLNSLWVRNCPALERIGTSMSLTAGADLVLNDLPELRSQDGLACGDTLWWIDILRNETLALDFATLPQELVSRITIIDNPAVDQCEAAAWAEQVIHESSSPQVEDNGPCAP